MFHRILLFLFFVNLLLGCQQSFVLESSNNFLSKKNLTNQKGKRVLFGVNGHAMRENNAGYNSQYNQYSIEEQVEILKTLNVNIYRNDIHIDENGFWNGESPEKFEKLLSVLNSNDIQLFPMIFTNPWRTGDVDLGENWNYRQIVNELRNNSQIKTYIQSLDTWKIYYELAFTTGKNFSEKYGDRITYYNIGNEIAYRILKYYPHPNNPILNPTPQQNELFFLETFVGEDIEDFFTFEEHAKRTVASAAYVSGMIDGIKSVDKDAKCVINDGKVSFGYFKFLEKMDVNYDIIGWNWYEGNFSLPNAKYNFLNVYDELNSLTNGKPIWITETNSYAGSLNFQRHQSVKAAEQKQAEILKGHLEAFYYLPNIEAIFVYELIDQEPKEETYWENCYGLIRPPFPTKEYAKTKIAFDTYRYTIEELQYGIEDYLNTILHDLFSIEMQDSIRDSLQLKWTDSAQKEILLKKLIQESDRASIALRSENITKKEVEEATSFQYNQFLKRAPSKSELRYWGRQLKRNKDLSQIPFEIILSDEYFRSTIWSGYERRTGFRRPN